jgi:hypothetical protein
LFRTDRQKSALVRAFGEFPVGDVLAEKDVCALRPKTTAFSLRAIPARPFAQHWKPPENGNTITPAAAKTRAAVVAGPSRRSAGAAPGPKRQLTAIRSSPLHPVNIGCAKIDRLDKTGNFNCRTGNSFRGGVTGCVPRKEQCVCLP